MQVTPPTDKPYWGTDVRDGLFYTYYYHRDEFFEITRVSVVDEYREANAEFAGKLGRGAVLRKALMTRARQP